MAYTYFLQSTTAYADQVDNNFSHVAQGNRLPLGGTMLAATNSVYDIGSSSYKWNNVSVKTLNIYDSIDNCMALISEVNVTATAAAITISGLNSSIDEHYEIICNIKAYATCNVWMFPNQDSNTANYGRQNIIGAGSVITTARELSLTGMVISQLGYDTTTALYSKTILKMMCTIAPKIALTKITNSGGTYTRYSYKDGQVWNNTATITSLLFTGYFDAGTNIQIWAKR